MLKKMFLAVFIFVYGISLAYSEPPKKNALTSPIMKKKPPVDIKKAQPPRVSKKVEILSQVKTQKAKQQFTKKRKARVGVVYIYPPYEEAWKQIWTEGTGEAGKIDAQKDGYTFHSGSSYAWGMSSSRCWMGFYYIPPRTGRYNIKLEAYQEGNLRTYLVGEGEVYTYRNIGISIEGLDWAGRTINEVYYNRPVGEKNKKFADWNSVGKEFYLQAGRSYWITGYSEVGGWSSGDIDAWQTTSAVSAIGPFMIQYLGK